MNRRIAWVMLVAGVAFFGGVMISEKIKAAPQYTPVTELDDQKDQKPQKDEEPQDQEIKRGSADTEVVLQLKEINAQLKELKALLCSGRVTVGVVQNPENVKPEEKSDGT